MACRAMRGNSYDECSFINRSGGGNFFGVPVADRHRAKENSRDERWSLSDAKPMVSALFEESGEIAPVDLGLFGKRAGEIIAHATRLPRRRPH